MRAVIFANAHVGHEVVKFLLSDYREDIAMIVTTDRDKISEFATDCAVPTCVYNSQSQIAEELPGNLDLGVLAWWPKIVKQEILQMTKLGFINTHPSFLPWNKGKHYNFWALVEEAPFGVTIHKVDEEIDNGDILFQKQIEYDWTDTGATLYQKAQDEMIKLFMSSWPMIRSGSFKPTPQPSGEGSFHSASEIDYASHIDLEKRFRARDLLNRLRARTFRPHPACSFYDDGICYEVTVEIRKKDNGPTH